MSVFISDKGVVINCWGGGAGKFWGRAKIFWACIQGRVIIFWAPLGDVCVLLNGFCVTELLSTP